MSRRTPGAGTADAAVAAAGTGAARGGETARAYETLRRMILDNQMPPGAYMLHEELAARLGVSRTPVREALIRLEQDGLIEIKPRHGMRVVAISVDDMREIYRLLTVLEALAAQMVAERGLGPAELAQLDAAVGAMDAALAVDDLDAWAAADTRFHGLLVSYAGSRRLEAMVSGMLDQSHRVRQLTLRLRPKPVDSNADHRALVDAIRQRDAAAAAAVHRAHRERSGAMLIGILQRLRLDNL